MADKRWRGAVFDLGVGLAIAAIMSGPVLWTAAVLHRVSKRALVQVGVL